MNFKLFVVLIFSISVKKCVFIKQRVRRHILRMRIDLKCALYEQSFKFAENAILLFLYQNKQTYGVFKYFFKCSISKVYEILFVFEILVVL